MDLNHLYQRHQISLFMRSVIAPGTTVLVTEASVKTGSGGQTRTVIDAQKL